MNNMQTEAFAELVIGVILPWITLLAALVLLITALFLLPWLIRNVVKNRRILLAGIIILVLSTCVRFALTPNIHRIYYDEDRYLGYSVTFARFGKATTVELATPEKLLIGKPDQAVRTTVPVLHAAVLKTFGYTEQHLFIFSKIISILGVLTIMVLTYLLFKRYSAALLAGFIMGMLPINVYWSPSLALDPYFVFFGLLSFTGVLVYLKKPGTITALFTVSAIFLLLCVRLEGFLFLLVFVYYFIAYRKEHSASLFIKKDMILFYCLLPLILIRGGASISVLGQKWCCADSLPLEAFHIRYVVRNLLPNMFYLIHSAEFPFFLTIPAWIVLLKNRTKEIFALGLWILLYCIIYSFYYAGRFVTPEYSGSYARYFLVLIPPIIMLFSFGIDEFIRYLGAKKKHARLFIGIVVSLFAALSLFFFKDYKSLVTQAPTIFNPVDQMPIIVHEYMENVFIKNTPKDAILIHPITPVPLLHGRTIVYQTYFVNNPETIEFVKSSLEKGKKAYLIGSYECDVIPEQCRDIKDIFEFKKTKFNKKNPYGFEIHEVILKNP